MFVVTILQYVGMYDPEEILQVEQVLKQGAGLSNLEKRKSQIDYMVEKRKYAAAIRGYDMLLETWNHLEQEGKELPAGKVRAAILHNKGVALTGLMFYGKAAYYFNEAWKTDPDREHLDAYLAAKRMELTEDAYVAFAAQNPENYTESLELEKRIEQFEWEWEQQPEYRQLRLRGDWRVNDRVRYDAENEQEEDWEQLVYTRNGVNFDEEDQRKRYIVNCLEQIAEASKEIDLLTGEYTLVTSYLTDTDEIEALPAEQREEVNRVAGKLAGLEQERSRYREKKNRMRDADFYAIRKRENEIEEGIQKIRDGEKYGNLIRQDLHRLDGERHAYEYRRNELENLMNNQRGMAVIFLTALIVCVIMLVILQYAFEMDVYVGLFLAVGAGAVAISYVCIRYMDAGRELQRVEKTINKIIQLQNKVKIRYVNNCQLMEYLYLKYNTDSAAKLEKQWKMYQDEKEERKQFAEAEAKIEYYQKQLVQQLAGYRVQMPERWISQTAALLDKREMVEIRHELIQRRQVLRKQMDYNQEVAESARNEVKDIAATYPKYAQEILAMVERYDR